MGIRKSINFNSVFLFLFLILFPFGQIIRIGIVQPIDVVVGCAALYTVFAKLKKPVVFGYLENFLIIVVFSWIFSALAFWQLSSFYGLLYLLRFVAYFYFSIYVWNFAKKKGNKKLLLDSLLGISIISAIFGWLQYFIFPSIKPFTVWGWDEHLFRLVGTFLDPTFLGIIIVFGLLILVTRLIEKWDKKNLVIGLFLVISLAFTYSRASYLAFFAGLIAIAYKYRKYLKNILFVIIGFLALMLILPTSANHVLSFTRQFSAIARLVDYRTTLQIFTKSPIFGVGYDNMCVAYNKFIALQPLSSHACSGSDSSILFILATTGVVGLISFISLIVACGEAIPLAVWKNNSDNLILYSSFAALLVHSLFSNSLVYSWVLGWIVILLGISLTG